MTVCVSFFLSLCTATCAAAYVASACNMWTLTPMNDAMPYYHCWYQITLAVSPPVSRSGTIFLSLPCALLCELPSVLEPIQAARCTRLVWAQVSCHGCPRFQLSPPASCSPSRTLAMHALNMPHMLTSQMILSHVRVLHVRLFC